jgi:hypothetical protein
VACALFVLGLIGCTSRVEGSRDFMVPAGQYALAFDATRDALHELDFDLDRVDAAAGVITTRPHFSQGLFEPWDHTQTGARDEWEDAANMQAREVRVTFVPADANSIPADDATPAPDMRDAPGEVVGSVWVTLYRHHRAGRRLDSEWVGGSTTFSDPALAARAGARYLVPLRRDEHLESRLAAAVRERLGRAAQPDHQGQ